MYLSTNTTTAGSILVSKSDLGSDLFFIQTSEPSFSLGLSRAEALELAAKLAAVVGDANAPLLANMTPGVAAVVEAGIRNAVAELVEDLRSIQKAAQTGPHYMAIGPGYFEEIEQTASRALARVGGAP